MRGLEMEYHLIQDDYDHFVGSVSEQLTLMLWTCVGTLAVAGAIIALAMGVGV
jgi:hypothetical protein